MPAIEPHLQDLPAPAREVEEVSRVGYGRPGVRVHCYPRAAGPMVRVYIGGAWRRGFVRARYTLPGGFAYLTDISPDGMNTVGRMFRFDGESIRELRQPE